MEEPKEVNLKAGVVEKSSKEGVVVALGKLAKEVSPAREEQQAQIVRCGKMDFSHDVTICLVPRGTSFELSKDKLVLNDKHILTKVKVHSSRLSKCSKYFETCLTDRWKKASSAGSSSEFVLETHVDSACYVDCFSRMYKPSFFKDFKDVNYSLGLLKAASQIQFLELVESIALYLSSKLWSDVDEMAIRMYATGHDFPRNHAQDLVVRLGMDETKEECHKQLCDLIEQCLRTALAYDGNFRSNRAFFTEMLLGSISGSGQGSTLFGSSPNAFSFKPGNAPSNGSGNGPVFGLSSNALSLNPSNAPSNGSGNGSLFSFSSNASSLNSSNAPNNGCGNGSLFSSSSTAFSFNPSNGPGNEVSNGPASGLSVYSDCMRDVVTIVNREAKSMVVQIAKECEGKTYLSVQNFADKILAICWVLGTLLTAKVAEEFVQRFVHLQALSKILAMDNLPNRPTPGFAPNFGAGEFNVKPGEARNAAVELAKLVFVIYQEVAAGSLLLKTPERIALLENWHPLFGKLLVGTNYNFDQATKDLFMTIPLKQQMVLVKLRKDSSYEGYISTNSLAKLVKKQWPSMEANVVAP